MAATKADEPDPDEVTPGSEKQEPIERRPAVPGTVVPEDYPLDNRKDGDVSR